MHPCALQTGIVYYMVDLAPEASRFFTFLFIMFLVSAAEAVGVRLGSLPLCRRPHGSFEATCRAANHAAGACWKYLLFCLQSRFVGAPLQMHQLAVSLFRMIGALSRTQTVGSTIGCGSPLPCSIHQTSYWTEHLVHINDVSALLPTCHVLLLAGPSSSC